jgi:hypothetical protein
MNIIETSATTTNDALPPTVFVNPTQNSIGIGSSQAPVARQEIQLSVGAIEKLVATPSPRQGRESSKSKLTASVLRTTTQGDNNSSEGSASSLELERRRVSFAAALSTVVSTPLATANDIMEAWRQTPSRLTREIVTPDNANRWIWTEGKKNGRTTPIGTTIKQMIDIDRWI